MLKIDASVNHIIDPPDQLIIFQCIHIEGSKKTINIRH